MCKLPDGRDWWWEKLGLALVGRALLSTALIQLSVDGWDCTPSLLVVRPEGSTGSMVGLMVNWSVYTKGDLPVPLFLW